MMKELLPDYYLRNGETETAMIQDAVDLVFTEAQNTWGIDNDTEISDSFLQQLFVATSTWGLALWEKQYGLETDTSKSDTDRRSRIMSKMRGKGTTTAEMIQNLVGSFVNGNVTILESPETNFFVIKFGDIGIPPLLNDLSAAIDEIKPAHLYYTYDIRYVTHKELAQAKWTHGALQKFKHEQIRKGEINGDTN